MCAKRPPHASFANNSEFLLQYAVKTKMSFLQNFVDARTSQFLQIFMNSVVFELYVSANGVFKPCQLLLLNSSSSRWFSSSFVCIAVMNACCSAICAANWVLNASICCSIIWSFRRLLFYSLVNRFMHEANELKSRRRDVYTFEKRSRNVRRSLPTGPVAAIIAFILRNTVADPSTTRAWVNCRPLISSRVWTRSHRTYVNARAFSFPM